jgi:hypothetical protein
MPGTALNPYKGGSAGNKLRAAGRKSKKQLRQEERAAQRRARQPGKRQKDRAKNLAPDDPRRAQFPRTRKSDPDQHPSAGNGGHAPTYVQGGAGRPMPLDNKHATGFGKPKSHKRAGWVVR